MAPFLTLPRSSFPAMLHKATISLVLLLVLVPASTEAGPDFASARNLINSLKPNLKYDDICAGKLVPGQMKKACRIKSVLSVGFLVCRRADGEYCKLDIDLEVSNIRKISAGGVRTVKIDNEVITGVKCADTDELTCSGFLAEWIDETAGWFHRLDTNFKDKTVPALIKQVREKIPTPDGRMKTADDMRKIQAFMIAPEGKYHLICDLQGFFLFGGGYLVNDPKDVMENKGLPQKCDIDERREPTTAEVINGLTQLINDLSKG